MKLHTNNPRSEQMNGILKARNEAGMTQQELADSLNIDRSTVAKWETGAAFPTGKKIPLVAKALGCEVSELFQYDEKKAVP